MAGNRTILSVFAATAAISASLLAGRAVPTTAGEPRESGSGAPAVNLLSQTKEQAEDKSKGCLSCHEGIEPMHPRNTVHIACVDCHGGDGSKPVPAEARAGQEPYERAKKDAHVRPRQPEVFRSSANPARSYAALNREDPAFIQFFNPGDLRVADRTCGASGCHGDIVRRVRSSMMAHGAMLWGSAAYNNGVVPKKDALFGEAYTYETPAGESADGRAGPAVDGKASEAAAAAPSDGGAEPQPFPRPPAVAATLVADPPPTEAETLTRGWLPWLLPLPRYEVGQTGNVFRIFERGGKKPFDTGLPERDEEGGKPARRLSQRGPGTLTRVDPVILGAQKTRLFDPTLNFLGTNDHPGDYRSSGCTACHVIYANDRSEAHSGSWAKYGHRGTSASEDRTLREGELRLEPGHPIRHQFTRSIPSSQCIVCHVHPGTTVTNSYLGTMWWDLESDGRLLYPTEQRRPTPREEALALEQNPEASAVRGLWSSVTFLEQLELVLNPVLSRVQFAGFAGHGWIFRNVYKRDRKGRLLNDRDEPILPDAPDRFHPTKGAVHLKDIHLEKGMHCVDCHFEQDVHGSGHLYGEVRAAVEIDCVDCHGTIERRATLLTTAAAGGGGRTLARGVTPFGAARFSWRGDRLFQRSMLEPDVEWEVVQVRDTIDPRSDWAKANPEAAEQSRLAKTLRRDGVTWGDVPAAPSELAHANRNMTCFTCHTAWVTSCFGCHLPMKANQKTPMLHNEGDTTRNYVQYCFQTLRDDIFMLGRDGTVTGRRIAPVRSACSVSVSSQNINREWVYSQQQTVSAEGFSGVAFSTFVPHTVRSRETKRCNDCHLAKEGDNNAWMASVLMQGGGLMNFMGRFVYVGEGHVEEEAGGEEGAHEGGHERSDHAAAGHESGGFEAVVVTERSEPQAVIGSTLHRLAYPDDHAAHEGRRGRLTQAVYHHGEAIRSLQLRGEYLYAACGKGGLKVYDVANIDNKGFSEKAITAPVSPLGQRLYVKTRDAAAVAAPSTLILDPARGRDPKNQEGPIHPMYGYVYVADREEGLIVVEALSLFDGDPTNNFLRRAAAFNPERESPGGEGSDAGSSGDSAPHRREGGAKGTLDGASALTIAGTHAYIGAHDGLFIVSLDDPLRPRIVGRLGVDDVLDARAIAVQLRYAFLVDAEGFKVVDVTDPAHPRRIDPIRPLVLPDARSLHDVYLARTYAYVAAGDKGVAVIDIETPESPVFVRYIDGGGVIDDARAVKIGVTNASLYAYVADGKNGLRVIQLATPEETPEVFGFSPDPKNARLIATYPTRHAALALSRGLDRDRAVDETGHQLAVFGRRGARPLDGEEARRMYMRDGKIYTVTNDPPSPPRAFDHRKEGAVRSAEK